MSRYLVQKTTKAGITVQASSAVLSRNLRRRTPTVSHGAGIYLCTEDGRQLVDACGGSDVVCVGHDNAGVKAAIAR